MINIDDSSDLYNIFNLVNICFVALNILEVLLKMTAIGTRNYFEDEWNIFDFIMALLSLSITIFVS